MNLEIELGFNPSIETRGWEKINPLCSDNRFHVRFRDYNKEETIIGIEQKLTFLLTYAFDREFLFKANVILDDVDMSSHKLWGILRPLFLQYMEDTYNLQHLLNFNMPMFKEIKLLKNYRKERFDSPIRVFGSISDNIDTNAKTISGMDTIHNLLSRLNISLVQFLFDDRYYLTIKKPINMNVYNKFTNRRRKVKQDNEGLWDF